MSKQPLHHLAQRIFNRVLAIRAEECEIIIRTMAPRIGITRLNGVPLAFDGDGDADDETGELADANPLVRGYDVIEGVAVIAIHGILVQRSGWLRPVCGMTGFDGIRQNVLTALDDPAVRAIALDVDSPGGEVPGCFDLSDEIYRARGEKPIWSILAEGAYSAAYALASAADRVIVPRTGGTGSIGVIVAHCDYSGMLAKEGVAVTIIQYGAQKADGAETMPLSDPARARIQADINAIGALFDETVARNRSLPAARVKGFEAGTFLGKAGLTAGLADAVMAPNAALHALLDHLNAQQEVPL